MASLCLACGLEPASPQGDPVPRMGPSPGSDGGKATTGLFDAMADAIVPSQATGALPGTLGVSDSGGVNYRVPLWVPAGRAGTAPVLSMQYSSGSSVTTSGVGWSIGGLSRISRCRRNHARDGASATISFTDDDPFCLDGRRLVAVTGPNGGDGTVYRTAVDSRVRIESTGREWDAPVRFSVSHPDGSKSTYGLKVEGPRHESYDPDGLDISLLQQPAALAWLITEFEDSSGNTISYEYDVTVDASDFSAVEVAPTRISYGGNSVTGAPATRRVEFTYVARPDRRDRFVNGLHQRWTRRLRRIEMFAPVDGAETEVTEYRFSYANSPTTRRSLLRQIRRRDAAGTYLQPLSFRYSEGADGEFASTAAPAVSGTDILSLHTLDANGDGLTDLAINREGQDSVWLSSPGGSWAAQVDTHVVSEEGVYLLDLDHDGDDELVRREPFGEFPNLVDGWQVYEWAGDDDGFTRTDQIPAFYVDGVLSPESMFLYAGDFDGDGAVDVSRRQRLTGLDPLVHQWTFGHNNTGLLEEGTAPFDAIWGTEVLASAPGLLDEYGAFTYVFDIDGDGRDEVVYPGDPAAGSAPDHYRVLGLDSWSLHDEVAPVIGGPQIVFLDINGDGLEDQLDASSGPSVRINLGRGFAPWRSAWADGQQANYIPPAQLVLGQELFRQDQGIRIFDENNDGRMDFATLAGGSVVVYRSNGTDFELAYVVPFGPGSPIAPAFLSQAADLDGNGTLDFVSCIGVASTASCSQHLAVGEVDDLLERVTNGRGRDTRVDYTTIADGEVYEPGDAGEWPSRPVVGPAVVVDRVRRRNPAGGFSEELHRYADARIDRSGPGWLGFAEHKIAHPDAATLSVRTLDQTELEPGWYPTLGRPTRTVTRTLLEDGRVRARRTDRRTQSVWRFGHTVVQNRLLDVDIWEYELDAAEVPPDLSPTDPVDLTGVGAFRRTLVRHRSFDTYGHSRRTTTRIIGGERVVEDRVIDNRADAWQLGLVTRRDRTVYDAAGDDRARSETYSYDDAARLEATTILPEDATLATTTRFLRGEDGLVERREVEGAGGELRFVELGYDDERIFPTSRTNALGHTVTSQVHSGLGVTISTQDANGLVKNRWYDGFGRVRHAAEPDGTWTATDYASGGAGGGGMVITQASDGGFHRREHNLNGQAVRTVERSFGGEDVVRTSEFDALGRLIAIEQPHLDGDAAARTELSWDALGRSTRVDYPDGTFSTRTYDPFDIWVTDAAGNTSWMHLNRDGRPTRATAWDDGVAVNTRYSYLPGGLLETTTGPNGAVTTMGYDALGRRVSLTDPDAGLRTFGYNAFGETEVETLADGSVLHHHYDALGRRTRVDGPDGSWTSNWDSAPHPGGTWRGFIHSVTSPDGVSNTYAYDPLGRVEDIATEIEGVTFHEGCTYDVQGRLQGVSYPSMAGASPFTAMYDYNEHGFLAGIRHGESGTVMWRPAAVDAHGRVVDEWFGNEVRTTTAFDAETGHLDRQVVAAYDVDPDGPLLEVLGDDRYLYDETGNLTSHTDAVQGRIQMFEYDDLGRLEYWELRHPSAPPVTESYAYDAAGNLLSVTDAAQVHSYEYGAGLDVDGAGPHAVTNLSSWGTLTYDGAGRTLTDPDRSFSWTTFDLPKTIETGSGTTTFAYDAANQRAFKSDSDGDTYYVGRRFERRVDADGTTDILRVFSPVGPVVQVERQGATQEVTFLHAGRNGSVTLGTDATGNVAFRQYFDPFGGRTDEFGAPSSSGPASLPPGYTGHLHDDDLGMINMRGRVFDPRLRRFSTPDPLVSNASATQGLNRYTYALNNPLKYTDPTGFQVGPWGPREPWEDTDDPDLPEQTPEQQPEQDPPPTAAQQEDEEYDGLPAPGADDTTETAAPTYTPEVGQSPVIEEPSIPGVLEELTFTFGYAGAASREFSFGIADFHNGLVREHGRVVSEGRGETTSIYGVRIGIQRTISFALRENDTDDLAQAGIGPLSVAMTPTVSTFLGVIPSPILPDFDEFEFSVGAELGISATMMIPVSVGTSSTRTNYGIDVREVIERNENAIATRRAREAAQQAAERERQVERESREATEAYEASAALAEQATYTPSPPLSPHCVAGVCLDSHANEWEATFFRRGLDR